MYSWQEIDEHTPKGCWILVCDEHEIASWQACWHKGQNCYMSACGMRLKRAKLWMPMPLTPEQKRHLDQQIKH